jgi:hypothetical protein
MDGNGQPLTRAEFLEAIGQLREHFDRRFSGTNCHAQTANRSFDESVEDFKRHFDQRMYDLEMRLLTDFANYSSLSLAVWPPPRAILK